MTVQRDERVNQGEGAVTGGVWYKSPSGAHNKSGVCLHRSWPVLFDFFPAAGEALVALTSSRLMDANL